MSNTGRDDLYDKVAAAINYVCAEFDMQYSEVIGILEAIKFDLLVSANKGGNDTTECGED